MAFSSCVPAASSAAETRVKHRVCNCQSCRNTGHDQIKEFSYGAKTMTSGTLSGEDDDGGGGDESNNELLFHQQQQQQPNLVNLMLVLKNQSNITDNNDINYVDSSQLPNNITSDTTTTNSTTLEKHRSVISGEVAGTNYETTHDSNNYLLVDGDHEFNTKDKSNVKRVWKMQTTSRSNIFVSLRLNTFLLIAVSTIFLLTISSGVHAGPINSTQVTQLVDSTTERVSENLNFSLFVWLWTIRIIAQTYW